MGLSPDFNSLRANFFFDIFEYLAFLLEVELEQNFILKGSDWQSFVEDLLPGSNWRKARFNTIYVYVNKDEHVLHKAYMYIEKYVILK